MRDPFPIVAKLGERLERERTGWRDTKALIVIVAREGDWNGAAALADALGVHPDQQEAIYREVREHPGGVATPTHPPRRSHTP